MLPNKLRARMFGRKADLERAADAHDDLFDDEHVGAIHVAGAFGSAEDVLKLTMRGLDPDARDIRQMVPMHYACWMGNTRAVRVLLAGGADPNAQDVNGCTPLHYAARYGCKSCVEVLLDAGAAALLDNSDRNALHQALLNHSPETAAAIVERTGCNPNQVDKEGSSLLVAQAMGHHFDTVVALACVGADPDFRDPRGNTAAECLMMCGQKQDRDAARAAYRAFVDLQIQAHLEDQLARFWYDREHNRDW